MEKSVLLRIVVLAIWWWAVHGELTLTPIKQGEFPFYGTMSLKLDPEWQSVCAVTIIANDRCFTACHCLAKEEFPYGPPPNIFLYPPSMIRVYSGLGPGGTYKFSEDTIALKVHPKCQVNATAFVYDYAVIQTRKPFHIKDNPKLVSAISFPGWKDGSGDASAITKLIQSPKDHVCVTLEFDLISYRQVVYQLGGVEKVAGLTIMSGKKCREEWDKRMRDFDQNVQVCARREGADKPLTCVTENECALDAGSLMLCAESPDSKVPNIPIGLTTGRDAPYYGHLVPEVYARLDAAWDFLTSAVGERAKGAVGKKEIKVTDDRVRAGLDSPEVFPTEASSMYPLNSPNVGMCPILFIFLYTLK